MDKYSVEIVPKAEKEFLKGPESDHNNPKEKDIWFFKVTYNGVNIYIKLKLSLKPDRKTFFGKCLSFHESLV